MAPTVKLDCDTIRLIAAAIAEGRVVTVPEGQRALPECELAKVNAAPVRAEGCRSGRQVERAPHLDEIDRERV